MAAEDNLLELGGLVCQTILHQVMEQKFGKTWFERTLRPHVLRQAKQCADKTGEKYAVLVQSHGNGFLPGDMDITAVVTALLYDPAFSLEQKSRERRALNQLRATRGDLAHPAPGSGPRERLRLESGFVNALSEVCNVFALRAGAPQVTAQVDAAQDRLFRGNPASEQSLTGAFAEDSPLARQYARCEQFLADGEARTGRGGHLELAQLGHVPSMLRICTLACQQEPPDFDEAVRWLERATAVGSAEAAVLLQELKELQTDFSLAVGGDTAALVRTARHWEQGNLLPRNQDKAAEYYGRALEAGSFFAENRLAELLDDGVLAALFPMIQAGLWGQVLDTAKRFYQSGVYDKSYLIYKAAAEDGNVNAMRNLALCYSNGKGCEKDLDKAFAWYEKAAEAGNIYTMNYLAGLYKNGWDCEKDLEKAFAWYEKAAVAGSTSAIGTLAACFEKGEGCEKDLDKAFAWYEKAVKKGHAPAMYNLAVCYKNGTGCEKNLDMAFAWFNKAAEKGVTFAKNGLAVCYANGEGCEQDLDMAFALYKENIERLLVFLRIKSTNYNQLVESYERDLDMAFIWDKTAAEAGDTIAMNNLAFRYANGVGCEENWDKAFAWFKRAAEEGNSPAMYNLAVCYKNGTGCEKDLEKVLAWFNKAAEEGVTSPTNRLLRIDLRYRLL